MSTMKLEEDREKVKDLFEGILTDLETIDGTDRTEVGVCFNPIKVGRALEKVSQKVKRLMLLLSIDPKELSETEKGK